MAVINLIYLISTIFLLATSSDVVMYGTSEGEKCEIRRIEGVCTLVSECGLALAALKRGVKHRMSRCGFTSGADAEEIVCCPKTSIMAKSPEEETTTQDTDTRGSEKRKCEQYCKEISTDTMKNVIFHIIGGRDAEEDEFRHMAALGWKTEDGYDFNCGGTIIDSKFCLTAAHCFMRKEKPEIIRVGATRLDDPNAVDYKIKNIIVHNGYSPTSKHHDIALIETEKKIIFNKHTYPACLYTEADDPSGTIITGWGKTSIESEDDRSNILQKAMVEIVDLAGCNKTYFTRTMGTKDIDETQLCAGTPVLSPVQTDACWGDSGGPIQIQNKMGTHSVVGVTSYGQQCGSRAPGVYTRVCKYIDWLEKHVSFTK